MKRFILKAGLFFLIIGLIDIVFGDVFSYMTENAMGGNNGRNIYICNKTCEDILVLGSSRANHHYNPIIISDSTGMSCYNCGQEGNGIILNYGRFHLISQRYHPKLLIYDVVPGYDYLVAEDNHRYLGWLRQYYDRIGIPEIFESVDSSEKYKMISHLYRYNSKFLGVITDFIRPVSNAGICGFRPVDKEMDTMKITKRKARNDVPIYDSLKLHYIDKMINESGETKFVFVVSPYWDGMDTTSLRPIKNLCYKHNIPFLDFSNDKKYVHNNLYFMDGVHLNARGADEFTRDLVVKLKCKSIIY